MTPKTLFWLGAGLLGFYLLKGDKKSPSQPALPALPSSVPVTQNPKRGKKYAWPIQAYRFKKSKFSRKQVLAWLRSRLGKRRKLSMKKLEVMKNFWGFRTETPKHFSIMRTIHLASGVTAIIGKRKVRRYKRVSRRLAHKKS